MFQKSRFCVYSLITFGTQTDTVWCDWTDDSSANLSLQWLGTILIMIFDAFVASHTVFVMTNVIIALPTRVAIKFELSGVKFHVGTEVCICCKLILALSARWSFGCTCREFPVRFQVSEHNTHLIRPK